jgi:hypothetical protein
MRYRDEMVRPVWPGATLTGGTVCAVGRDDDDVLHLGIKSPDWSFGIPIGTVVEVKVVYRSPYWALVDDL